MNLAHKKNKFKSGFSVVEIIVVVAIFGVVSLALGNFILGYFNNNSFSINSLQVSMDGRSILRPMVNELRTMSQGGNGSYPISSVSTSSITFYANIDTSQNTERIRYFIQNGQLKKGVIIATGNPLVYITNNESISILASNVRNSSSSPLFKFYGSDYGGSTTSTSLTYPIRISDIRLVQIDLLLDVDPNKSPIPRSYKTEVNLRNLKDNL